MMKRKKTFFDEDIKIDEKLFNNFKLENIASWSHLELWCAIQNVEVNYEFFKGILCGTHVLRKLYDIVLDAINTTEFLDKYLNEVEVIEIIEKLFAPFPRSRTFNAQEFWIDVAYNQSYEDEYLNYFNSGRIDEREKKYKLLEAIFKKSPFTLLKFYDKCKMAIHNKDIDFEMWLLHKCKILAPQIPLFAKIYAALEAEIKKQNKLSMYMN